MATIIHTQNFPMTDAIRAHLIRRITRDLRPFEDRITQIDAFFKDINGSAKGGADKNVLLKVQLRGLEPVVVEHTAHDLYAAISVASRRVKRAVRRTLHRLQRIERRKLRHLPPDSTAGMTEMEIDRGAFAAGR